MQNGYYTNLMLSYIRGHSLKTGKPRLAGELIEKNLNDLTVQQAEEIFNAGKDAGLKLYKFKNNHDMLARVKRVMGFLYAIEFNSLLDAGSGRGVFLFPLLNAFPDLRVTSIDILPYRVELLQEVAAGGICNLTALEADICAPPFGAKSFDAVTLLEVLEHIPNVGDAVKSAVALARKFVVVSVPSREDNNPEHIHLLTRDRLTELFGAAGCTRLHFDSSVSGHLILIANVAEKSS